MSRCQRFDLSRIKSLHYLIILKNLFNRKCQASDDALKLIVKISEGSVRDALSLLDRGLLTLKTNKELDLLNAQKIYGYFDKSLLIEIFEFILKGNEKEVINLYRKIYDQGVDPKVFLNDFMELIYYFKNINYLTLESTNFSLNDEEFLKIKKLSECIESSVLILFWQFSIKTLDEIDIVSNQNLSIEMFLLRLMHLSDFKKKNLNLNNQNKNFDQKEIEISKISSDNKSKKIDQIKNITQEKKVKFESQSETINEKNSINSFDQLISMCYQKRNKIKI